MSDQESKLYALYQAVHLMMARLGADGEIDTRAPEVDAVMDAMHEYDGGQYIQWNRRTPQPVTPAGGEVGQPWAWAVEVDFSGHRPNGRFLFDDKDEATAYFQWREGSCNKPTFHSLYLHPPVADAALARDAQRLEWISRNWGGQRNDYAMHVLRVGGIGDADDLRTFVDAALNQRGGGDHG